MANVHFSSAKDEWETPQAFFNALNIVHKFTIDVCASAENTKCDIYFDKESDGLNQPWHIISKSLWMNPPYGRTIKKWMKKAYEESLKGCKVVCLVPARTDTAWWHEYAMRGKITFIQGRLKFSKAKHAAPFPSAIVIFEAQNV